jgi:hypothetical protein
LKLPVSAWQFGQLRIQAEALGIRPYRTAPLASMMQICRERPATSPWRLDRGTSYAAAAA